jgi:hypothetical protein
MFATFHCIAKRASTICRIHPAGTALLAVPGCPRHAEVFAQGPDVIFAAEEVAALEFGDDAVDEVVEAAGDPREHDVEAVAGGAQEPLRHLVGDHLWRADHREAAIAAGDLRQLADRQVVAAGALDDTLAAALAGVALRDLGQWAVEVELRGVAAERDRQ